MHNYEEEHQTQVENALLRLILGGKIEEEHIEEILDPASGEVRQIKRKRTIKTARPDYRALIFWLTNRLPWRWLSKPKVSEEPEEADDSAMIDEDWLENHSD